MEFASPSREKMEHLGTMERSCRSSPSRAARQDVDAASETSSVHSGDPSDRRDVDSLTQVLSTRSEEYRLLFRLPTDEVLVQDFNCALQENFLLQGHMYLFIHHICFYSNIFGFETKKTISFNEVTCVRKAKTAAIFPNAIEIVAGAKKHFFASFLSRDEAYRLIVDGWAQHSSDANASQDCQDTKSDSSSQDSGIVKLEELRGSKQLADASLSSDENKDADISEEHKPLPNGKNDISMSIKLLEVQESIGEENAGHSSPRNPITWKLEDVDAPKIPEYFTMVAEAKFLVCVEDFFSLFISDSAADFLESFHKRCGDKDFKCTPWCQHKQFGHVRDISFLHPVKIYLGAKFGNCREVQKFCVYRNSRLMIEASQQVSDVPYGDYFQVKGIWDVEQSNNEENSCTLRVYSNVSFSKKTIFKGKIEQSTREECREVYGMWINMAQELLSQKNVGKLKGIDDKNTGIIQDHEAGLKNFSEVEGYSEKSHPTIHPIKLPQNMPDTRSFCTKIDNVMQENLGYVSSMASSFGESWASIVSYLKTQSHFPLILVLAVVSILILMQISIIVLLNRVPEVHVVTQGNYINNLGSYSSENIEWLEKRFNYLKEEMMMVETRMERMRYEYSLLKVQLQSLEQLKAKS
ncbi:protein VASCULAR ASSOCIATED DEATH 1, chloroplastic isoform X1 [Elaeis guineensis]|uniref:Protein VASCULAR ASSOCIATED DEATH 1, chloroplastic isoform X1 n=1 Tax=Elaeis guineensis var. tenera TaxID=51953 RepID=A0A6I9R3A2_ELAGV|nr:protein VASCULAR ASSOCIATED DEATH 1, chloroplastic isoform X1 [Elaeis guineensis]